MFPDQECYNRRMSDQEKLAQRDFGSVDTIGAEINRENIMAIVGVQRAVLMQVAHPLVAQSVIDFSQFDTDTVGRFIRTRNLGQRIAFGDRNEALGAVRHINRLHDTIHGTLKEDVGAWPKGTPYDAMDPELLKWVWASLIDTSLVTYERFVRPLSGEDKERFYQESRSSLALFGGKPEETPDNLDEFRAYMDEMVQSRKVEVGSSAREIAHKVFVEHIPGVKQLAIPFNKITADMLPEKLREQYGLEVKPWEKRLIVDQAGKYSRLLHKHMPFPKLLRFSAHYLKAADRSSDESLTNQ